MIILHFWIWNLINRISNQYHSGQRGDWQAQATERKFVSSSGSQLGAQQSFIRHEGPTGALARGHQWPMKRHHLYPLCRNGRFGSSQRRCERPCIEFPNRNRIRCACSHCDRSAAKGKLTLPGSHRRLVSARLRNTGSGPSKKCGYLLLSTFFQSL